MKKYFELFVNISLIISIFALSPGLIMNIQKVSIDSLKYWTNGDVTISETVKIQSMEDFQNQHVSKAQTEQALRSIFESP
ncbi:MAG: hypothetical protein WC774_01220 [Candidatus Gracilibacteria bacterium]|jgi:hypothetical protein